MHNYLNLVGTLTDSENVCFLFYNYNRKIRTYTESITFYRLIQPSNKIFQIENLSYNAIDGSTEDVIFADYIKFLCLDSSHYYLIQTQFDGIIKPWSTNVDSNNPDSDTLIDIYELALNKNNRQWEWKCITVKFFC